MMNTNLYESIPIMHPHRDGGTFITLDSKKTVDGWAITVTRWITYRGEVLFEVHRESPKGSLFRLSLKRTEGEARAEAEKMWQLETSKRRSVRQAETR